MSFTQVEQSFSQAKRSTIAVKTFFDPAVSNMGLEKYNLALFEGVCHEESVACLENNGVKRYITGLNEFAPELHDLEPDVREAKIKQIRQVVSRLEKELNANVVNPDDPEFWNKVKLLSPNNSMFWDKIKIRCSNEPLYLEPEKDAYDLIKLYAIEAGGFSMIAKSMHEARTMAKPPKFYLDRMENTASTNTEVKKLRNKAGKELDTLFNKNTNKLFYICKVLDPNSVQYKKNTPTDIMYNNMDMFINGELMEKDKRKTAERFIAACALDMETIKLQAVVKDATQYKLIASKADGFIYHLASSQMMGRNVSDVVEYLKNPLNEDILKAVQTAVENHWNA